MKTSLSHLPERKQKELHYITHIITEKVHPEKVILFGSHATGKWVEDMYMSGGITYEYISDYDILVVVRSGEDRKDHEVESLVENQFDTKTPINIIVHDIDYVNRQLSEGQYFFNDIRKEGIMMYDAGNVPLEEPRELSMAEVKAKAEKDFEEWFTSSKGFLKTAINAFEDGEDKIATFLLHQSTERIYNCVELVFTGYRPKIHNLKRLYTRVKRFSKELAMVFPRNTKEEKHLFEQLKKGYVEARYDSEFVITKEELTTLISRVQQLQSIAENICKEWIEGLG